MLGLMRLSTLWPSSVTWRSWIITERSLTGLTAPASLSEAEDWDGISLRPSSPKGQAAQRLTTRKSLGDLRFLEYAILALNLADSPAFQNLRCSFRSSSRFMTRRNWRLRYLAHSFRNWSATFLPGRECQTGRS